MKISFDIDCTPEEARRIMGLPDLTPVHDAYIERMTRAVSEGLTPDAVTQMMQGWGPMSEAGTQMMKTMFGQGIEAMTGASRPR
ncbi:MAG TPA: DUF6489 family protein [Sphingomonadaceae bacterium]|nr:DUF6489 family protein [Sphingomonadaceae bacterium]